MSRELAIAFRDACIGFCLVDACATITHIEGRAMQEVGTDPADYIGRPLEEPYLSEAFAPAMEGQSTVIILDAPGVRGGGRQVVVLYEPRFDGAGRIVGAVIWWIVPPAHQVLEVRNADR